MRIEFYPSKKDFPRCYYRLNSAAAGNKIPAETVLLHQAEASSIIASQARALGFKQQEKGFMDSGQLVFSAPKEMECPFWTKATKAVLKSFRENETQAFTGLKE